MGESPLHRRPGLPGSKMNNGGMNLDQVLNRLQVSLTMGLGRDRQLTRDGV